MPSDPFDPYAVTPDPYGPDPGRFIYVDLPLIPLAFMALGLFVGAGLLGYWLGRRR